MIALDTSALIAIVLDEPEAERCVAAIERDRRLAISAGTVAEALIVAARRGVGQEMSRLIGGIRPEIVAIEAAGARRIAGAYERWGRGYHRSALNFGDCFAYALAEERACPLLFVGDDFSKTDVTGA
ncbi:MAG: type II toxin-antitoxin system VapC family toxin [Rhodospirillales bacterium]|nr:type II toxin-antitoxin system VapC family toxin [Rhodospirillales bacterium]